MLLERIETVRILRDHILLLGVKQIETFHDKP